MTFFTGQDRLLQNLRISKIPPFLFYQSRPNYLKARHWREIVKSIQPGDILLRTFHGYLEGKVIPGTFTSMGFYLGEVTEAHLKQFAHVDSLEWTATGKQIVIHADQGEAQLQDLLDFAQCDGLVILRFPETLKPNQQAEIPALLSRYFATPNAMVELPKSKKQKKSKEEEHTESFQLDEGYLGLIRAESDIANHLASGKPLEYKKIFKLFYRLSLKQLNQKYRFNFELQPVGSLHSSALVLFLIKSIAWNYYIEAMPQTVFFSKRRVLLPDQLLESSLEEVWKLVL